MEKHKNPNPDSKILRRKAEDQLKMNNAEKVTLLKESDVLKLVHELQVYKIELEIQNEELALAKKQAAALAAEKYNELYDFAPSGYFTLSREGKISQLNLAGAKMLGRKRSLLVGIPFNCFISNNTKPVFQLFVEKVFAIRDQQTCEISLSNNGNEPIYVQLTAVADEKGEYCLVTAVDITESKLQGKINLARLHLLQFADNHTLEELLEETINQAEEVTGSLIGFYHFVEADQKTLHLQNWSTRTKKDFCLAEGKSSHYDISLAGVWADCVRKRCPVVHNEYSSLPDKKGMPPGHAKVLCELVVPVFEGSKIVAILGVGNKTSGYKENDVELVSLLADLAWDIVRRKKAEEALHVERKNFFAVFESSPVAMLVVDETTNIVLVNLAAIALSEGNESGFLQHRPGNALRCVHSSKDPRGCGYSPDCRLCKLRNGIEALIAQGGELHGIEVEMELLQNEKPHKVWLRIGVESLQYSGSRHWCIAMDDISEQKKAEVAIRLSEEKFRGIFDQASVGAAIVNMEKRFLRCNPAFCNFLRYSDEELSGKSISDVTFPEDASLGMPELKKIAEKKIESATLEKRYLTKDGNIVWGELSISLVSDEKNSPIFFLALIQDITERKHAEEALKHSEKHFRELADSITDVFFEMDTDLQYTYWNKASENLLGIKAESAIGKSMLELFPGNSDITKAEATYREVLKTRKFHIFESVFEYNGKQIIFEIRVYPTTRGISVFTTDITERKRAEKEIKLKNEELLKTNAEKDKFFSIIAHDLRSPFNAFLGLTQLMEEELPSLSPDEIRNFAASMRKSANMLFHLLENLLEWSRMQRGLISFKPETLLLSNEIIAGIELVRDAAEKKMIVIRQDIPGNLFIKAEVQMFESVMRNLVFNAIKFTPKNGKISLAAKKISDTLVQISVSDTGIGMSQELISRLFQLEEQTQRKGTEGEPSTGLGLIICRDLVEKHGGTIWVESKVSEGSTFYFTIPLDNNSAANSIQNNSTRITASINPTKKLKILIVEDDEISRLLISTALNPYSREMLFTRKGTETVETARNNPDIDLIMMDIQMPEMDGYQATRQIRHFNDKVVIIAQTAFGLTGDREKATEAGCNDYIAKPINQTLLKKMILKHYYD